MRRPTMRWSRAARTDTPCAAARDATMIKYLGSKRALLPAIRRIVGAFPHVRTALDLFSGTARVGHALKAAGYRVFANDCTAYAHALATCYVQADREDWFEAAQRWIAELNRLPGKEGYFNETYCRRSRFFHPKNGARVDAIREWIAQRDLPWELEAILLVSLMEAADRVDSTTGLQMAYLKEWAPRAHNDLVLRVPQILPMARCGKGSAYKMDALEAADALEADLAYIDPPYNQHSFLSNYHIWETLTLWDRPAVYGVACKRADCRERKSAFNSRRMAPEALGEVIRRCRAPVLVVSFNDEGFISREWLEEALRERGEVVTIEVPYKRYVGAQIGIYNPSGEKVGQVGRLTNHEYLYVAYPAHLAPRGAPWARAAEPQGALFAGGRGG